MDRIFEYHGNSFVWDDAKAAENLEDHGVTFEEAATVFDDPKNPDKLPSGSAPVLDYSPSCISRSRGNSSASSQLGVPAQQRKQFMLNERLKKRLKKRNASGERALSEEYLEEVVKAYEHFFFHYTSSDLLIVNTSEIDFVDRNEDLQELLRKVTEPIKGTQYFLPLGGQEAASA